MIVMYIVSNRYAIVITMELVTTWRIVSVVTDHATLGRSLVAAPRAASTIVCTLETYNARAMTYIVISHVAYDGTSGSCNRRSHTSQEAAKPDHSGEGWR